MTAVCGTAPPPAPYLADYAHLAICENGATESERDEAISRPRAVVLGVWDRAPSSSSSSSSSDDEAEWMPAPHGGNNCMFSWVCAPWTMPPSSDDASIDWDEAPLARRKRVRREQRSSSPPPPPPVVAPPPQDDPKKRRARPEQNLYNDHKAALRALDRQMRNDPGDAARVQFIRDEVERRKRAADDYAVELRALRAAAKEHSAREKRRFSMMEMHDQFVALTARVGARHGLRHLDSGALLFAGQ